MVERNKWYLVGFDTFEGEEYPLEEHNSQESAEQAAMERLLSFEESQPSNESGGQAKEGIQDQIFVVRPDGTRYRFIPPELKDEL